MIRQYFETTAAGIEAALAHSSSDTVARKLLTLELARLGSRLFSGEQTVAWCGVVAPFDLLHAMGVTSCFVEFVGAMLASSGSVEPLLEKAEQGGYATDSCAYHRAVTGANLQGLMPAPDLLIATSAPCTGSLAVVEELGRHHDVEMFVLNVPHDSDADRVDYLEAQLREMVSFVARRTGHDLDPSALRRAIENTNRMRELLLDVYELAQAVPSPARPRDLINFGIVMALLLGSDAGVAVAQAYRDEFARKVAAGVSGRAREDLRLMWLQNRIQFKNPVEDLLEKDLAAAIVVDELNDITWDAIDPDDPYRGIAERMLSIPLVGQAERRIRNIVRMVRDYRVDGVINPCHWGCRQGTGARGLIESALESRGIPVLSLEVDCIDPRSFSPGQLRTRLEAFAELLQERREGKAQ